MTLAAQSVWGVEPWMRRGEAFSVYFNMFSRISAIETRDRVVGLRPPLSAGCRGSTPLPGTVAFVMVMIGTVTFDGLSQGALWNELGPTIQDVFTSLGFGIDAAIKLADTLGLVAAVLLVAPASTGSGSRARGQSAAT